MSSARGLVYVMAQDDFSCPDVITKQLTHSLVQVAKSDTVAVLPRHYLH